MLTLRRSLNISTSHVLGLASCTVGCGELRCWTWLAVQLGRRRWRLNGDVQRTFLRLTVGAVCALFGSNHFCQFSGENRQRIEETKHRRDPSVGKSRSSPSCTQAYIYLFLYIHTHLNMCIYMYMRANMHLNTCVSMCVYYMHVYADMYIYAYLFWG